MFKVYKMLYTLVTNSCMCAKNTYVPTLTKLQYTIQYF